MSIRGTGLLSTSFEDFFQELGSRSGEGITLNNIGEVYRSLSQHQQALDYFQQALKVVQKVGARSEEGTTLSNIGGVYRLLDRHQQAWDYYQHSLKIIREIGDRDNEAMNLSNIGELIEQKNQPELAIVFYKQSVKVFESIREGLRPLPRELQQSYTEKVAGTYRRLADLLLKQDRILEAQRVLDLLKLQEIEDFNRRGIRGSDRTRASASNYSPQNDKSGKVTNKYSTKPSPPAPNSPKSAKSPKQNAPPTKTPASQN